MKNQMLAASIGALRLVANLMQDREFGIRYKAALAIEALAMNNVENQKQFLSKQLNVQKPLNELMEVTLLQRSESSSGHFFLNGAVQKISMICLLFFVSAMLKADFFFFKQSHIHTHFIAENVLRRGHCKSLDGVHCS